MRTVMWLGAFVLCTLPNLLSAKTISVPDDYLSIQAAIDAAEDGDVVEVAPGIWGGGYNFNGKAITVRSRNGDPETTIVDGSGIVTCFTFSSSETANAVLEGFTLRNGFSGSGGGIHCNAASPTINKCIIAENRAGSGGGIYCNAASPTITKCLIIENRTSTYPWRGGGIGFENGSHPTITECTVTKNAATFGAGIWGDNSSLTIVNSIIHENTAVTYAVGYEARGGGVYLTNGSGESEMINCTVVGNTSQAAGIDLFGGVTLYIRNTILWGNQPKQAHNRSGSLVLLDCDVENGFAGMVNASTYLSSIESDPLFVDLDNGDYHLLPNSPCIDKGMSNGAPVDDYDGDVRPFGIAVDIGADEYAGPLAHPQSVETPANTPIPITLVGSSLNGGALTFHLDQQPEHGDLTGTPPDLTYTPHTDYVGGDSFTFYVSDGVNTSAPATVDIAIQDVSLLVGDVSGDGEITSFDASLILQFVAGLISEFPIDAIASEAPENAIARHYQLSVPALTLKAGQRVQVPVSINDVTGLIAGGVTLRYDPTVLRAVDVASFGPLSGTYWRGNADLDSEVRFAFAAVEPLQGSGRMFVVEFEALPNTQGRTSDITLEQARLSGSLSVEKIDGQIEVLPDASRLLQNYPNPFNPETWIPYQLANDANVEITLYNASGQEVRTIDLGLQRAGSYLTREKAIYWDGRNAHGERVSSGLYLYRLHAGDYMAVRRLVVLK